MANINGTSGNDAKSGISTNDILNANWSAGTDIWAGGEGNDTYYVDSNDDLVIEVDPALSATAGFDTVLSRATDYVLPDFVESLTLDNSLVLTTVGGLPVFVRMGINGTGNDLDNTIRGNDNANILSGLGGNDWIYGNGGIDTLNGDAGNDYLFGGTGNDTLNGGANDDRLWGEDNDDIMNGGDGADVLYGGSGNDTMTGGAGNDTYYVEQAGDTVVELSPLVSILPPGVDTVVASITHTLAANVEYLTMTGTAAIDGTGNVLNNVITGNSGNNKIDGKAGVDTMRGLGGDDTYYVENVSDVVSENAAAGTDEVISTVTYTITDADVEVLSLDGGAAINGTGNASDNTLNGTSAANTLKGLGGDDKLFGKGGDDIIEGGFGADNIHGGDGIDILRAVDSTVGVDDGVVDRFYFSSALGAGNVDLIDVATFDTANPVDDQIHLDHLIFGALTGSAGATGTLNEYYEGAGQTGNGQFDPIGIYLNTNNGRLYYNSDFGTANSVQFATLNDLITDGSESLQAEDLTLF